jgi:hypothetical protein
MARLTIGLGVVAACGIGFGVWQMKQRMDLEDDLAALRNQQPAVATAAGAGSNDPWANGPNAAAVAAKPSVPIGNGPALTEAPKETRMDRRVRRTNELTAMFGRLDGETEEEYRQRFLPMVELFFNKRRRNLDNLRKQAEEKANITPEQSAALDKAFEKVYDDAIDYTNQAIAEGMLSPYKRDVSSVLEFAGGLGGVLRDAEGQIGTILSPEQMKSVYESGFEWGEYLGVKAPWERLNPPPPPSPEN